MKPWLALLLLASTALPARPQVPPSPFLDLDFEAPECAGGWMTLSRGYDVAPDPSVTHSGKQSLRLRYAGKTPWKEDSRDFGNAMRAFPVAEAAGKKIRFSGFLKTENVAHGYAGLWWRVDGKGGTLAFDNLNDRGAKGTTPWTRYDIELAVPAEAQAVYFGALLAGDGTAWVDSLAVTLDGKPWEDGTLPSAPPPSPEATAWLKQHALPFKTAEPGHGLADLEPLKPWIGKARLVALGEATHGTREFFQMKHRLTELLASQMGFTVFAIEASMPETELLNRYVLTGQGDPAQLVKGMGFWTWSTREVLDLVLWVRAFNQSGKGTVQFRGFDMQNPQSAAGVVRTFVAKNESDYSLAESYGWVDDRQKVYRMSPDEARGRLAGARGVLAHLEAARGGLGEKANAQEVGWAIQNARIVVQFLSMMAGERTRDESMADNVEWLLAEAPKGTRIVLWAHNGHVQKTGPFMGTELAKRFGPDYLSLGFAFGQGRYRAVGAEGLGEHDAPRALTGSLESYLASAGLPRFALDLRGLSAGSAGSAGPAGPASAPARAWLAEPRPFRQMGAMALRCGYKTAAAAADHDLLIYFDDTSPSVMLP